jgi:hypothetical protein
MDASKVKKLQDYASFLMKQAESKEQQGNSTEAARDYVKLVDILLLLANEAKDHPTWQQIITKVEYYQKKVKALGSGADSPKAGQSSSQKIDSQVQGLSNASPVQKTGEQGASSSSLLKSFRKISSFGKNQSNDNSKQRSSDSQAIMTTVEKTSTQSYIDPASSWMSQFPKPRAIPAIEAKEQAQASPSPAYLDLMAENDELKKRVAALEANEKEYLSAFEEIKKQTEEKIASMVPKQELEAVQLKLLESVSKTEYEKLKEVLKDMVPKEKLREAERYTSELEARLENSIPRTVLSQIAEYTSLLISSSSFSLVESDEAERTSSISPIQVPINMKDPRQRITLDVDHASKKGSSEKPESILLEINMKPQTAEGKSQFGYEVRRSRSTKIEEEPEIEVQSELSGIQRKPFQANN